MTDFERQKSDPPYEASDQFVGDFKWLMRDVKGRRLVYWLLSRSGVFRTTFDESPLRAQYMSIAMAHAEGRKDMGYRLMGKIGSICPDQYTKMMKENANG